METEKKKKFNSHFGSGKSCFNYLCLSAILKLDKYKSDFQMFPEFGSCLYALLCKSSVFTKLVKSIMVPVAIIR